MPIKVLMFGWEFPPHNSGGLGTACFGLARALINQEVDLTFVLPRKLDLFQDLVKIIFADNSRISFTRVDSPLYPYLTHESYIKGKVRGGSPMYGRTLLEEVYRYAALAKDVAMEEEFDVIHAHDWLSFPAGLSAKQVSGKPLIVHVHATEIDRTGGNVNQDVFKIEKEGMEQADQVIAVSQFTKDIIVKYYGIDPEKITVVHNGIEPADYQDSDPRSDQLSLKALKEAGNKIVLFVGRVTFQKGPDYFIQAAHKVLQYMPNVFFVIAGTGDMEHQIMQEAASLGISDKVIFAGFLRGQELNAMYRAADLFVLPSVSEPFGIAPLESVVNGTPVLISKQSGVSEVLTHALRADFWDVDDMTDKILCALQNPSMTQTLQENSQNEVKRISWKEAALKCRQLYRRLIHQS